MGASSALHQEGTVPPNATEDVLGEGQPLSEEWACSRQFFLGSLGLLRSLGFLPATRIIGCFFLCFGAFVSKDNKSPRSMGKYHLHFVSKALTLAQGHEYCL